MPEPISVEQVITIARHHIQHSDEVIAELTPQLEELRDRISDAREVKANAHFIINKHLPNYGTHNS